MAGSGLGPVDTGPAQAHNRGGSYGSGYWPRKPWQGLQGYSPSLVLVVSLGDLCVVKLEGSRRPHDIRPAHAHKL